ncbi:uncharacterized protein LOC102080048 isoform X2 [Oreochromis niloticus]|uniref:uncharacterized protein LOC102080048 isoform X2 n=1 Tax=Oreochromis niloticus TaxID=8128 RepID=UPI000DF28765|nr:uncharacterized protein LOC102080048 isoform X2 [Oreochromis niloticus]
MVSLQKWKEARPCLIDNMLATLDPLSHRVCQCGKQVVVRCLDCLPLPFLCAECDIAVHTRFVLHNREAVTGGFLQPSSEFHKPIVRLLPVQRPDHVCDCPAGCYNLALPVVSCTSCDLMWSPSVKDILGSGYWPGTLNFCTLFSMDVFQSFYDIKKAAPGMSLKAFVKMLDERTAHFGREVAEFMKYIQRHTNEVAQLRNLLSMRPFLSVMHAKALIWKCEIKWGGAFQDGAGSTTGKEVGQVNSFLSRAATEVHV